MFHNFAAFGSGAEVGEEYKVKSMDNMHYAKLIRECGLLSKKDMMFGTMDLIYTRAKPKGSRKLEFKHFLEVWTAPPFSKET